MKNRTLIFALIALMTLGSSGCFNKKKTPSESPVISESLEESETSEVESHSENESTSESNSVTESESESESMSEEESESESESTSETESGSDSEEPPVEDLDAEKQAAIKELRDAFNELDMEDYSIKRWNNIVAKFNQGIKDINNAVTRSEINEIKNDVLAYFANSPKASEVTKGTWFDYHSADSNYQFDRDDNNNLVISYDGYPGHWVYCGTKNLETDVGKNNILSLTFRNDIEEEIEVCLQATDDSAAFKADTGITKVGPLETKTLVLHYDVNVTRLYFFIDSCNVHERQGQVTILKQELGYEEKQERAPKTVDINQAMTLDDQGANTGYTFTASDYPYLISRVDAVLKVDYHGNGNSLRWYGLHLYYNGSNHISVSDSQVHAQEFGSGDTAGQNIRVNCPIDQSSKIAVGDTMHMDVSYQASGLTFTVVSYTFYYTLWKGVETETIEVNRPIYQSGSNDGLSLSIPYSSFQKKGTVRRMDVTFTTVNTESYGKSQIHFSGFNFTTFPSGNNNVLNIGSLMNKSDATPKQATVSLYPTSTVDLTSGSSIVIDCWWASASDITVDSITMYTDNVNPPETVTGLEVHPIDKGVVLNWSPAENATSYDVYKDGDLYQEVASTYITIDNLVNGTEYTFGVVAKNLSGESDMVTIKGTPVEGASYDTFIETLNTNLENQIGSDGITNMFDAGSQYLNTSNNERLKSVISKMQNGEETTVAFFGGSITVGETASLKDEHNHAKGYAYYTYQWLKRNYDVQNKSRFVNGSICGTGSEIGIVRAKKDMLNYNPDLIFIEFAGNNGTTNFYKESYESLVRECLKLESNPCIVLVFSATYYSGSAEGYMKEVGDHYHLPMFTMDKAMRAVCSKLDQSRTDPIFKAFTDDGTHPNDEGHQLYAKCLCYSLRTLIKKATDSPVGTISSTCFTKGNKFEGITSVDNKTVNGEITSLGSFAAANTGTPSTRDQSDVTAFQQGWKKTSTTENNPMTIEVNAKNFVLIYEAGNADVSGDPKGNIVVTYTNKNDASDTGTLTWDVTKTIRQSTSGSTAITDQSSKGWQNPVGVLIFDKDVANDYIITIKMESADGICTIMAFGYTK